MNSKELRIIGLVFLALPFIGMILMVATNYQNLAQSSEYRIKITGYDPRDILRGHYLTFRYDWPEGSVNMYGEADYTAGEGTCACLSNEGALRLHFGSCVPVGSYKGSCRDGVNVTIVGDNDFQPAQELRQYYIPEEQAALLEKLIRSDKHVFEVGLVPQRDHGGQLKNLYIDGVPLDEFLARDLTPYMKDE